MKILLTDWAARLYAPIPSAWVLAQWRRQGQIHPAPEKVGREWYVEETARRITAETPRASLVDRLKQRAA